MQPGGLVANSGQLLKNDVVVKVNGTSVSADQVASEIVAFDVRRVTFDVRRDVTFDVRRVPDLAKRSSSISKLNPFKCKSSTKGGPSKPVKQAGPRHLS